MIFLGHKESLVIYESIELFWSFLWLIEAAFDEERT